MNVLEHRINIALFAVAIVCTLLHTSLMASQEQPSQREGAPQTRSGIYPVPIFFYTPETGVAGGAAALFLYHDSLSPRASGITTDVIYTQKKQFITEISGDMYLSAGRHRLTADLMFQKYPNKFFGIGNNSSENGEESYTPQSFLVRGVFYTNVFSHLNIGPTVRYEHVAMNETSSGGVLSRGILPGSGGGTSAGFGIVANWDSRDNTYATQSGSFYQLTTLFYRRAIGSDYSYDDIQIDTRNFLSPFPEHIVAIQGMAEIIDGDAPFQSLAKFGGQSLLRGYFDGRYRDNTMVSVQAEYRLPLWWRFGLVGFAGVAQVSRRIGDLAFNRFWFAGGAGLRFAWSPEERINIRLDYGAGNNTTGLYVTITEAF
jgi:hypothetical protein